MTPRKFQIRSWHRRALITLLIFGGIWGGLKWSEKAYAKLEFKWDDECAGYEFQSYHAFSLLGILPFEDRPNFIRVIEKKTGRVIGETDVHWTVTSPKVICPDGDKKEISLLYGTRDYSEHFSLPP